jgi:hypothetical protein
VSLLDKFKSKALPEKAHSKKEKTEPFVQIPLAWGLAAAAAMRCPRIAFLIWLVHLAFKAPKGAAFPVSNSDLEQMGVSRDTKRDCLYDLETRRLIKVTRRNGAAPLVLPIGGWWQKRP